MKQLHLYLIIGFSLFLTLDSCKKDDDDSETEVFFGYQYAPLKIGQERIYQVDSILFDDFSGSVDTISFQKREVIESSFNDLEGKPAFRTKLYQRSSDTSSWKSRFVFTEVINDLRYERRIDNLPVIHLVFPIKNQLDWNGNALNTEAEQEFEYQSLHQRFSYDSLQYDSSVTVLQREEENLIQRINTLERYAAKVGLVYRYDEEVRLDIQSGEIESGYKVTIKLIGRNF